MFTASGNGGSLPGDIARICFRVIKVLNGVTTVLGGTHTAMRCIFNGLAEWSCAFSIKDSVECCVPITYTVQFITTGIPNIDTTARFTDHNCHHITFTMLE